MVVMKVVVMMVVMVVVGLGRRWGEGGRVLRMMGINEPCLSQACDTLVHQHKHQRTQVWKTTKRCYGLAG